MSLTGKRIVCVIVFAVIIGFWGCNENNSSKVSNGSFGVNLIKNSSFENWADSIPDEWKMRTIDEISSEGGLVNRFARSSKDKMSGNYSCYFESHDTTDKWVALVQVVPVIAGHDLIISSDIRTKNLRSSSIHDAYSNLFVRFLNKKAERLKDSDKLADAIMQPNVGTKDWYHMKKKVVVPPGAKFAQIGLLSTMSGVIYFDNVEAMLRKEIPWVRKETKYIIFYSLPGHPFPEGAIEKEVDAIESYAEKIKLGKIDKKINYYYYSTEEDFMRINLEKKYYEGVKWEKREIHTMKENEDLIVTHMLIYDFGFPPLGLAKGLIFYLRSYKHNWNPHREAKEDLINHKIQPLYKSVSSDKLQRTELSITIPAWTSFCAYIIGEYGMENFLKLYKESDGVKELEPFEKMFERIYEREFPKVDMDWRLWLMRYEPKGESTPMP